MKRSDIRLEILQGVAVLFVEAKRLAEDGSAVDVIARQEASRAMAQAARDFVAAEVSEKEEEERARAKAERSAKPRGRPKKARESAPPVGTEQENLEWLQGRGLVGKGDDSNGKGADSSDVEGVDGAV